MVLLKEQGLWELFLMEIGLTPLLLQMRQTGVRIDTSKIRPVTTELKKQLSVAQRELNEMAGFECNYNAASDLARAFGNLGLEYPLTKKTKQPSFTK